MTQRILVSYWVGCQGRSKMQKGWHSHKSYQLKNFEKNKLVLSPYQGFNFFYMSLSHIGPALSYWALNFLESTYMYLSGLVRILWTHLNYTGLWGWEVGSLGVRLTAIHLTESFPCWPRCPTTHQPWGLLPLSNPFQKYLLIQNEHHGNPKLQEGREVSVQGNKGVVGTQTRSIQERLGVCHLDLRFWVLKLGIMDGTLLILDFRGPFCSSGLQWEELHIYLFGTSGVWSFWGRNQENLGSEMKETKEGRKIWHIT